MKKACSGTILTSINKDDFLKIPLPIPPQTIQNQISEKVQKSFKLRRESKELLELAKRAVEVAIEDGEDKGLVLISNLFHSNT
jgi:restriction endonuclease S subunit